MKKSDDAIGELSRYLASTLHEIRTPIQTIIGTSELLQDTNLDKEQQEYVRQILFSASLLHDLANNILDFTRIRSNNFKLESIPFNIIDTTEKIIDLVCIEAFNKGLEVVSNIDYSLPQILIGDPARIQQIILNLLKNAVKFTEKGYIEVRLFQREQNLVCQVIDTGIGISEEKKSKIFTDYFQTDVSTYRKYGGSGLGLSICKNLVSVMNGEIGVEKNPGGGSIFWFTLPLKTAPRTRRKHPEFSKNHKILIVDDNELSRKSLETKLKFYGITDVVTEGNPDKCQKILQKAYAENSPFTAVFIDMFMPIMDGWHLANEINSNHNLNDDLLLFLLAPEGQMQKEAKMKMLNWFDGYLYKPIRQERLFEILNSTEKHRTNSLDLDEIEELELATDESVQEFYAKPKKTPAPKVKVLVAEDHPVNRKLMESVLLQLDADVYLAEDGFKAVQVVRQTGDIDIIFMDIQMPVKNGIEATLDLRKDGYDGIIIACTANNDQNDFVSFRKAGMNDILVKPFNRETINSTLEKWKSVSSVKTAEKQNKAQKNTNKTLTWNKKEFFDITGGDIQLSYSLISTYIEQTEYLIRNTEIALSNLDMNEVRENSHKLSGSSATIYAETLAEISKKINNSAKQYSTNLVKKGIDEFNAEYTNFKNMVEEWKKTLNKAALS